MEYSGKLPTSNVNVSKRSPLGELALLLGGLTGLCFLFYLCLGWAVDTSVQYITPEQETKLYEYVNFPQGLGAEESQEAAAVQALLARMQECAPLPYPVSVQVVQDDQVNAAAFPGGHILVFSGLLDQTKSENELAFILGHELGHFKNRDHLRSMGRGIALLAMGVVLLGPDTDVGEIIFSTLGVAQQSYSRGQESAADRYALDVLNCHYGHVGGSTQFFETLKKQDRIPDALKYFSTHPSDQKRIDDINALAEEKHYQMTDVIPWQVPDEESETGHPEG